MPGYQIVTLDFQTTKGMSGWFKKKAALSTQKIPTVNSEFTVSCGVLCSCSVDVVVAF